jgi:hypothetical protein
LPAGDGRQHSCRVDRLVSQLDHARHR